MKNKIILYILTFVTIFSCFGCSKNIANKNIKNTENTENEKMIDDNKKAFIFTLATGNEIEISLDTSDNYDLISSPISITKDNKTITKIVFITQNQYNRYIQEIDSKSNQIKTKDNIEYIYWNYNKVEFNYAVHVKDSDAYILVTNNVSGREANTCFEKLQFKKVN